MIRKSKKILDRFIDVTTCMLIIVFFIVVFSCCGCEGQQENTQSTSNKEIDVKNIPNGEYTVLDVREAIGGNNLRIFYYISIVLKDSNDVQTYYSYDCSDNKDSTYVSLATLVPNNKVQYQNGTFKIISENE